MPLRAEPRLRPPRRLRRRAGAGPRPLLFLSLALVLPLSVPVIPTLGLGPLSLGFGGLQLGCDQRIVLGSQIDFVWIVVATALGRLAVADELVLALELLDVAHGHLELVGDPGIGTALPYPRADLI